MELSSKYTSHTFPHTYKHPHTGFTSAAAVLATVRQTLEKAMQTGADHANFTYKYK